MSNITLKILGIFDVSVAIMLACSSFIPSNILKEAGIYLFIKGLVFSFSGDIASILDVLSAIYILLVSFGISNPFISIIVFIYLLQKALCSIAT